MKRGIVYIFSFYLFFIISCSSSDVTKCSELKRGEFYYKSRKSFAGSTIKRNDSIQIVTDKETGKEQKEKIEWIDPCTYMLYPFLDDKDDSSNPDFFLPIEVTILDITKKYYTVNVFNDHYKTNFNDTVWIAR